MNRAGYWILVMAALAGCGKYAGQQSAPYASEAGRRFVPRSRLFPTGRSLLIGQIFDAGRAAYDNPAVIMWGARLPKLPMYGGHYVILGFYDDTINPWPSKAPVNMTAFNQFASDHPTWIEYKCDGKTPAWNPGWYYWPVDIGNPNVRRFLFDEYFYPLLAQGYNIDMDNVGLENSTGRCGHYDVAGKFVRQYNGQYRDQAYADDVLRATTDFAQMVHAYSPTATLAINTGPTADNVLQVIQLSREADLTLDEAGVTQYGWITKANWRAELKWALALSSTGRCFWDLDNIGSGREPVLQTATQRMWDVANYLLTKGPCSYITINAPPGYGYVQSYPEESVDYGFPLDVATERPDGSWVRHFSKVTVIVGPNVWQAEIEPVVP